MLTFEYPFKSIGYQSIAMAVNHLSPACNLFSPPLLAKLLHPLPSLVWREI